MMAAKKTLTRHYAFVHSDPRPELVTAITAHSALLHLICKIQESGRISRKVSPV